MITDPRKGRLPYILRRRIISFSLYGVLWLIITLGAAFIVPVTGLMDLVRPLKSPAARTRCMLFFLLYLTCEVLGLLGALAIWIGCGFGAASTSKIFFRMNYWLQSHWASALLKGSLKIFSMSLTVKNPECAFPGPILLMIRHASAADTVLASVLVAKRHQMALRFVLKQELLWDPCLDVVGNRLPNVFIERGGQKTDRELSAIGSLAHGLGARDGVLVYPEGTRFGRAKLLKIQKSLQTKSSGEVSVRIARFKHVLPPRTGGVAAIREAAPAMDAVICVHTGFEGAASFKEFWQGGLVGKTVNVEFWRIPAEGIPAAPQDRKIWLLDLWLEVDAWVARHLAD